jgi:hypothetical protein
LKERVEEVEIVLEEQVGRGLGVEASWERLLRGRRKEKERIEGGVGEEQERIVGGGEGKVQDDEWEIFEKTRNPRRQDELGGVINDRGDGDIAAAANDRRIIGLEEQLRLLRQELESTRKAISLPEAPLKLAKINHQDEESMDIDREETSTQAVQELRKEVEGLQRELEKQRNGIEKNNRDVIEACMEGMKEEYEGIVKKVSLREALATSGC